MRLIFSLAVMYTWPSLAAAMCIEDAQCAKAHAHASLLATISQVGQHGLPGPWESFEN